MAPSRFFPPGPLCPLIHFCVAKNDDELYLMGILAQFASGIDTKRKVETQTINWENVFAIHATKNWYSEFIKNSYKSA